MCIVPCSGYWIDDCRRASAFFHPSVLIVIITTQTPGLRIDDQTVGLLIFRTHDLKVAPLAGDQDVGPAVGRQFLADLFLANWPVAGNEERSVAGCLVVH
jgi:methylglyoxal synthase